MSRASLALQEAAKQEYLQESQLFAGLSPSQLARIDEMTAMTRCERGRIFFSPEDTPGTLYVLKEGRVTLWRQAHDGRQLILASLDRGSVFGESSMLGESYAGVYAEAAEECLLCVLPAANLRALMVEVPQVGLNLLDFVSRRLQRSQELAEQVAYWPVRKRLATLIVELVERYGHPTMDGATIVNKAITQAELGQMIGATRETTAEALGHLRGEGVIELRKRRIVVLDAPGLGEAAGLHAYG